MQEPKEASTLANFDLLLSMKLALPFVSMDTLSLKRSRKLDTSLISASPGVAGPDVTISCISGSRGKISKQLPKLRLQSASRALATIASSTLFMIKAPVLNKFTALCKRNSLFEANFDRASETWSAAMESEVIGSKRQRNSFNSDLSSVLNTSIFWMLLAASKTSSTLPSKRNKSTKSFVRCLSC